MPTYDAMKNGYDNLWQQAKIVANKRPGIEKIADRILASKARYKEIEKLTGVPWFMIGCLHYRESNLNFKTHLHCGDPLTARTYHVPAGRPIKGTPPFTFEESAVDALTMKGLDKISVWSISRILFEMERYNGWGYINKGNSPYVWSGTTLYEGGKYVADHVYDGNAQDKQMGTAAVLKVLAEKDAEVKSRITSSTGGAAAGATVAVGAAAVGAWHLSPWLLIPLAVFVALGIYFYIKGKK